MAETAKHTPGPWRWIIHDHSCASLGVGDDPGMGTPLVMNSSPCRSCAGRATNGEWEWGRCTTPSEANARLIAAAPDLLEALQAMLETYGPPLASIDYPDAHPITLARAAIAKATGADQ